MVHSIQICNKLIPNNKVTLVFDKLLDRTIERSIYDCEFAITYLIGVNFFLFLCFQLATPNF